MENLQKMQCWLHAQCKLEILQNIQGPDTKDTRFSDVWDIIGILIVMIISSCICHLWWTRCDGDVDEVSRIPSTHHCLTTWRRKVLELFQYDKKNIYPTSMGSSHRD